MSVVYTVMCDKPGCYWQASTENAALAILWGTEHEDLNPPADLHCMSIITEAS